MDEFSDFQMAVGPPSRPPLQGKNSSTVGKGWGGNQKQQQQQGTGIFGGISTRTTNQYFQVTPQQQQNIGIGPVLPLSLAANPQKKDKNVGSRLANYDLGRQPIPNNISSQQQTLHHSVPPSTNNYATATNHNLLIGEEDKYAALRALVSLEDCDPDTAIPTTTQKIAEQQPTSFSSIPINHNGHNTIMSLEEEKIAPKPPTNESDDFSDFGDFQSFSNPATSIHPKSSTSSFNNGLKSVSSIIPPSQSKMARPPSFDFGDFVSVIPENNKINSVVSKDYSNTIDACDFNIPPLPKESGDIFMADSIRNFNSLTIDGWDDDDDTLNISDDVKHIENDITTRFDSSDVLSLKNHFQSSNNNELPLTRVEKHNVVLEDSPGRVYFPSEPDTFTNSNDSESASATANSISSCNIPHDDLPVVLPFSFIKTSLIGCNAGSGVSDIDNLESIKSASLMETSNETLECVASHENKSDISPETRSIASLDLGSYCPTFDTSSSTFMENKISSLDNNWNGGGLTTMPLNRNSNQSRHFGENDDTFISMERGSSGSNNIEDNGTSDKYQCFRQDLLETDSNVHYVLIWSRCLESIKLITKTAVALFSGAANSNIVHEVVLSQKGENYINCLSEVYQVFSRVKLSHNRINKMKLETLCSQIENIWDTLISYFIGTDVLDKFTNSATTELFGVSKRCAICLCSLEDVQFSSPVEYDGVLYHSGCANLWINNVDTRLPSLLASDMQFDTFKACLP